MARAALHASVLLPHLGPDNPVLGVTLIRGQLAGPAICTSSPRGWFALSPINQSRNSSIIQMPSRERRRRHFCRARALTYLTHLPGRGRRICRQADRYRPGASHGRFRANSHNPAAVSEAQEDGIRALCKQPSVTLSFSLVQIRSHLGQVSRVMIVSHLRPRARPESRSFGS
jgi:hypothetical protein